VITAFNKGVAAFKRLTERSVKRGAQERVTGQLRVSLQTGAQRVQRRTTTLEEAPEASTGEGSLLGSSGPINAQTVERRPPVKRGRTMFRAPASRRTEAAHEKRHKDTDNFLSR
jgi:hypothetical protein